jgi:hypothetical protein
MMRYKLELNEHQQAMSPDEVTQLKIELQQLLNRHRVENNSNTPDSILAEYMYACLAAFEKGVKRRDAWYGLAPEPGNSKRTAEEAADL